MKQALVLAAGLGTRLRPLTDHRPKALVEVAGHPLLHYTLCRLEAAGFTHVVVNAHHFARQIEDYVRTHAHNYDMDIRISLEQPQPLETGGAIAHAAHLFNMELPLLVHNVDILSNLSLADAHDAAAQQGRSMMVVSQRPTSSQRYLAFTPAMHLSGWVNQATGEVRGSVVEGESRLLAFSGIHVIMPSLIRQMATWPERFSIIDFYLSHSDSVSGYLADGLCLLDVGKTGAVEQAERLLLAQQH